MNKEDRDSLLPEAPAAAPYDLDPKFAATKKRYLLMYGEYVSKCLTVAQLAKRHDIDPSFASRILKWAATYLSDVNTDVPAMQAFSDSLLLDLQKVMKRQKMLDNKRDIFTWLKFQQEVRYIKKLRAQAQGVLSAADNGGQTKPTVNVHFNIGKKDQPAIEAKIVDSENK